jgi:hypothetical protein
MDERQLNIQDKEKIGSNDEARSQNQKVNLDFVISMVLIKPFFNRIRYDE